MIPILDLRAQYHSIKDEVLEAIERTIEGCQFALGSEVKAFEGEFASYCQAQHGVATSCGTSALHLALLAAGVGPGDEVITVPFTFVATVAAIRYIGAKPALIDVEPRSLTMNPDQVEWAIRPRTKAIMPVHLYGQPADMDPILEIAQRRGLTVVEDAAQAHGAEYKGRRCGSMGDLSGFSFYCGKNLGAYGEAGLITTRNSKYDETLRMLRDWGCKEKYHHELKGFNYRMDGIQGAILRVKLRYLEQWTERRRELGRRYDEGLRGCGVQTPEAMPYARHVYHVYTLRSPKRDAFRKALEAKGIQTGIHYPIPVHLQKAHEDLGYKAGVFPVSEKAANEVFSLPLYPELTDAQQDEVIAAVREAAANLA